MKKVCRNKNWVVKIITVEKVFRGKSGQRIMIQRYGMDDYCAVFGTEFSVRGTLIQILREIQNEIPEGVF